VTAGGDAAVVCEVAIRAPADAVYAMVTAAACEGREPPADPAAAYAGGRPPMEPPA
jgi:hypothetical protein